MLKPNEGNKYVFKNINFKSMYLPPLNEVAQLLHLPSNISGMITHAQSFYDSELPVSQSSIFHLSSRGVGKPTFKKIYTWFKSLSPKINDVFNLQVYKKISKAMRVTSNASIYYSCTHGFNFSKKSNNNDNELNLLIDWLEERSNADYLMMNKIHNQAKLKAINIKAPKDIWQLQKPYWQSHSLVPRQQLNIINEFYNSDKKREDYTEEDGLALIEATYHLTFDFYLSAIANYEAGLHSYYFRLDENYNPKKGSSFFINVLNTLVESEEANGCFDAVLIELKELVSSNDKPMTWRKLASFIPFEKSKSDYTESGESLNDRQYKQLKDWRNGKNLPSFLRLEKFINAICASHGNYDSLAILMYFRISRGIDTKIQECFEQTYSEKTIPIFKTVIGQYPSYFKHYTDKLNKAAK
ncbi:hypothetical protein LOS73_20035 [Pseudoalteromonas sp. SCSIO 43210]